MIAKPERNASVLAAYSRREMVKCIAIDHGISPSRVCDIVAKMKGLKKRINHRIERRKVRAITAAVMRRFKASNTAIGTAVGVHPDYVKHLVRFGKQLLQHATQPIRTSIHPSTSGTLAAVGKADSGQIQSNASSEGERPLRRSRDMRGGTGEGSRRDAVR